jgi:hypothetical protein
VAGNGLASTSTAPVPGVSWFSSCGGCRGAWGWGVEGGCGVRLVAVNSNTLLGPEGTNPCPVLGGLPVGSVSRSGVFSRLGVLWWGVWGCSGWGRLRLVTKLLFPWVPCCGVGGGGGLWRGGVGGCLLRIAQWMRASNLCGQVAEGERWMPWHQEPMKDVGGRDRPGGVAIRAVIPGCPNGGTRHQLCGVTRT